MSVVLVSGPKGKKSGRKNVNRENGADRVYGDRNKRKKKDRKGQNLPRISASIRPADMSLDEWQRALRRQAARNGIFAINHRGNPNGTYVVKNPLSRNEYKVVYRGADNLWNYCSCMDFHTNRLGTCKHIEAVALWVERNGKRIYSSAPPYSSLSVSYRDERRVCLRIGSDNRAEMKRLAAEYFSSDGFLRPEAETSIKRFIDEAFQIDSSFKIYPDVAEFLSERSDRRYRDKVADGLDDGMFDSLLSTCLYPYQKEGIKFAFRAGKAIIADEMGLGKTVQAIGTAELLRREGFVSSVLIVCPTSLKYQWKKEIEKFVPSATAHVVEGHHLQRRQQYMGREFYKIVSYNSVCNDIRSMGSLDCFDMVIFDEVQRIKNWDTYIAKAARKIKTSYTVALSGTPLENKLEDLYSVMQLVDQYRLGPLHRFMDNSIITDERGKIVGYRNLHDIGHTLKTLLIRRSKTDVALQLPGRIDKIIFVPMTREQAEMHNEFKITVSMIIQKWQRMHFLSEADRHRLLMTLNMMRMVCDSTFILDQRSRHDTKVDETIDIVRDTIESGDDKIVIFSQWERMTRLIAGELDKRGIRYEYLHGGVPSVKRRQLTENFSDLPESRVFLSTDAGSTGLNLQSASIIINLDLPWNPAVLEQRIARIYRIGQKKTVRIINLVAANTIEERMLSTLDFKSNLFKGILDDGNDTIHIDDSRLEKIMQTIEGYATDTSEETGQPEYVPDSAIADEEKEPEVKYPTSPGLYDTLSDNDDDTASTQTVHTKTVTPPQPHNENDSPAPHIADGAGKPSGRTPGQLIEDGITLLAGLSHTLADPEATRQLVDTITRTDETTGRTMLNIPVPDKQTVIDALSLLGRLFGR